MRYRLSNEKHLLFIALSCCSFLKNAERLFLAETLDSLQALTVLSIEDISRMVNRRITPRSFKMQYLPQLVEAVDKRIAQYRIALAFYGDEDFPPLLREIPDAPFLLYYRGMLPNPLIPCIGMVGTRVPTGGGISTALRIASECGHNSIPVVSGLARGIDTYAHKGAIEGGGITAAVLACGVDSFYPRTNCRLAGKILEQGGCILSEYPPGELPKPYRFPQRNRIISGLTRSVVVIEAPEKSGALITAAFALEQGRDVCIASDILHSKQNAGCRKLAEEGAIPITGVGDILCEWGTPVLQYTQRRCCDQLPLFENMSGNC